MLKLKYRFLKNFLKEKNILMQGKKMPMNSQLVLNYQKKVLGFDKHKIKKDN